MKKISSLAFLFLISTPLFLNSSLAIDDSQTRESLSGIGPFTVLVDMPGDAYDLLSYTPQELQRQVEFRLIKAGIKIMPAGEYKLGSPYLYVSVSVIGDRQVQSTLIDIEFRQRVLLEKDVRSKKIKLVPTPLTTWKTNAFYLSKNQKRLDIEIRISKLIDDFIAAYKHANN